MIPEDKRKNGNAPLDLPVLEFAGSPLKMGEAFGESCRDETRKLYALRLKSAIHAAGKHGRTFTENQVLDWCHPCVEATRTYDAVGYEEFAGIARGAGLSPEQCFVLQGLTDLSDVLSLGTPPDGVGCSSFVVAPDRSATGHLLLGQTWDLNTNNMPYVRLVYRQPAEAPDTWSLTLTGCLTLIGINSEGIAVGNTNLSTRDVRAGVQYLSVLHRALRARTFSEALDSIRQAPRAAAHYYYAAAPHGPAVGLECSATRAAAFEIRSGAFIHCNHCLDRNMAALEATPPGPSSVHRQKRLSELLESQSMPIGINDLKRFLSDHEGGPRLGICRHDVNHVSTNATVILSPDTFEIQACRGQAHMGKWIVRRARP